MGNCATCGKPAAGVYCGALCAIGTPAHDTTHSPFNPALIEPDDTLQHWANTEWTTRLALERAGFTPDEAIQYLATRDARRNP
jgi:hypothetical protein